MGCGNSVSPAIVQPEHPDRRTDRICAPHRDATAVIGKQRGTIAALTQKVAHLETLLDRSSEISALVAREPKLLVKTVDALLADNAA